MEPTRGHPILAVLRAWGPELVLAGVVIWSTIALSAGQQTVARSSLEQSDRIAELEVATATLTAEVARLRGESAALEEALAIQTAEEIIFLKIMVTKPDVDRVLARTIAKSIRKYCMVHSQDPNLVLAMILVESKFDPSAVSSRGAIGLMQITPQWRQILGISGELTDPEVSIRYGLQILGFYRQMYKDISVALTAYHRGPQAVDRALMRGDAPTSRYAPEVLATVETLRAMTIGG